MIINEIEGDVTSPTVGIIGHGVNCQGVMGSGVALTIRQKFPKAYEAYLELCARTSDRTNLLGTTQLVEVGPQLYVANMFTQFNYGRDGGPYASIQAVREACSQLEMQRQGLIVEQYAREGDEIQQLVGRLFAETAIDLAEDSDRSMFVRKYIDHILAAVHRAYKSDDPNVEYQLPIYLPLIGCGLGGLQWETTRPSINSHTGLAPVTIYHYPR